MSSKYQRFDTHNRFIQDVLLYIVGQWEYDIIDKMLDIQVEQHIFRSDFLTWKDGVKKQKDLTKTWIRRGNYEIRDGIWKNIGLKKPCLFINQSSIISIHFTVLKINLKINWQIQTHSNKNASIFLLGSYFFFCLFNFYCIFLFDHNCSSLFIQNSLIHSFQKKKRKF